MTHVRFEDSFTPSHNTPPPLQSVSGKDTATRIYPCCLLLRNYMQFTTRKSTLYPLTLRNGNLPPHNERLPPPTAIPNNTTRSMPSHHVLLPHQPTDRSLYQYLPMDLQYFRETGKRYPQLSYFDQFVVKESSD